MITLTIKISYDPIQMNGSLRLANLLLFRFVSYIKRKAFEIKGMSVECQVDSNIINVYSDMNDPYSIAVKVFKHLNQPIELINSKTRKGKIVEARQVAMYFAYQRKNKSKKSLQDIGIAIGNKDHATVLHAVKTVENYMQNEKQYKAMIDECRMIL